MEWLDGEDLGQRQRRAPLGMRDAIEVVRRSAAAMAAVHARGVVHRDLKLSNIFLVRGKGTAVKLIDFGVVKPAVPDEYPTERGTIIGTPHFMAPEQARGEAIDARADVYSLGAVLFRLVTGRNVFETDHIVALLGRLVLEDPPAPSSVRFDVPAALDEVIGRSIARSREGRFESGGELARALARVGAVNNDPPGSDRSASAVRRAPLPAPGSITGTGSNPTHTPRPGANERRVVACVLWDLGGAPLPPPVEQQVREILGEDSRLEPLAGGRLVTVLGVERSRGDEALRAARAGLAVTQALPGARAAVAAGHAIRGRDNLAGEALERAARQIERAAPGTLRVDASTQSAIAGRFVVQEDGEGGVLLREDATGFGARQLLGRTTPTVGREKEIALLAGIYAEIVDDAMPRAAIVQGPAGIGKSRVRAELGQRLETHPRPPEIVLCRGDSMSQGGSLSALGRALRIRLGVLDGEPLEEQVHKVRHHVAGHLPRTLRFLAAFLGELVGVPFPDEHDEPLRTARASAQLMHSRLRMALEAYLRAKAEGVPQVLVIEDMHWADDTTLDLVDWLLGCQELRFSVFAFARPEVSARLPTLWDRRHVTRLALPPLSPLAADRLVSVALPSADATLRTNLVRRAGGNALFLEELVRCAADGREELPLTVQALVQMRLDRLSSSVREVLRAAAVFGPSFWTAGVEALVGRAVALELHDLAKAELVTRHDDSRIAEQEEWSFRQALVRDAAYASIVEEDRGALHLAAGAWLESAGDVDAGLVARHADAGGDYERAANLYARATRQAYTNGAQLETALELAERGLAIGAQGGVRAQLLLAKAQVATFMGRLADGFTAADEASRLAPPGSDLWGEAQRIASAALIESGRSDEGDARAAYALLSDAAQYLSAPMRATLLSARVRGLIDRTLHADALRVADEAVAVARAAGAPDALARTLDARVFALMQVRDASEAVASGAELIEAAETIGDMILATRGRLNTASTLNSLGVFEEAEVLLERALSDARTRRMRILEAFALQNLGMSQARLAELDRGIELARQATRIADETNAARLRVFARIYEAVFLCWRGAPGDFGAALTVARQAVDEARPHAAVLPQASFALARVQLARRAIDAAVETARDAAHAIETVAVEEWEEAIRLTLVEALLAAGEVDEADHALDMAFRGVIARARAIRRPEHRASFLRRIAETARIVDLARERLGRQLPPFG
jgi:tetratricopeptide (TPR) repeat protein